MLSNKYKIEKTDDNYITPEETLADSISQHVSVEVPITKNSFRLFYILIILVGILFVFKAFQLQIVKGSQLASLADSGRLLRYPIPSVRGVVYDRNGKIIINNIPTFDVVISKNEFYKNNSENIDRVISFLASILDENRDNFKGIFEKNKNNAIFAVKKNITKEVALKIQTESIVGVYAVPYAQRSYILGEKSAHITGYTSRATPDEIDKSNYYLPSDRVGRLGIESQYEDFIRGTHNFFDLNLESGENDYNEYLPNTVKTTIDADAQSKLYEYLNQVFRENGLKRGGAIVQDVNTGAVIAMVSLPSFDPNSFENTGDSKESKYVSSLLVDKNKPLFNRVISGVYSPGSTIKPFYALLGLFEKIVTEDTIIYSPGYIRIQSENDPSVFYTYKDWKVHGWSDVRKAIADSVDVYFYALGGGLSAQSGYENIRGLGIDRIDSYLKKALADSKLGIDLPLEDKGLVPSKEWKKKIKGESWYVGDTYNVSIGQGDLAVTPLWINSYISAVANGGNIMKPYLVSEIRSSDGNLIKEINSEILYKMPFDQKTMNIVKEGMRQTITEGTARRLNTLNVKLAGKTGTAQVGTGTKLNSIFTVYGPYDRPGEQISMTVFVEDINSDQNLAVEVAKRFMSWYFDIREH